MPVLNPTASTRIAPFATYMVFLAIADILSGLGVSTSDLRWLYPLKITIVAAVLWYFRKQYVELGRSQKLSTMDLFAAIAAGAIVFVLWINLNARWMMVGESTGFNAKDEHGLEWSLVMIRLAGAALIVPVMEELFWRSFLLRWIRERNFMNVAPSTVGITAFVITSILFAVEHNLWFAGLVAGATYNLLYMRSQNLKSPIIAHAVTNGLLGAWVIYTNNWTYW